MIDHEENQTGAENEDETQQNANDGPVIHDPSKMPKIIGKPFSKDHQATSEQKKAGWLKKKRNRELMQYILSRSWKKNRMNQEFHEKIVEMTGMSEEELDELTYEGMLYLAQTIKAIKQGDTQAAALILERAFGKPIQKLEFDGDETPPAINITIQDYGEVPPIA